MKQQGPILVPLDGSPLSEGAIPTAVQVAHALHTHLALLCVWEDAGSGVPPQVSVQMEEQGRNYFQSYLHGIRDRLNQPEARIIVEAGDPSDTILSTVDEVGARMVVVASHGRSGLSRWLYGSTTGRLLHESRVPLLVVGPQALESHGDRPAIKNIMVPLDGSPLAEAALETAAEFATACHARITLVRVVDWASTMYPYVGVATYVPSLDKDLEDAARQYLTARVTALAARQVQAEAFVVRGVTSEALLDFETQHDVDLVVMSTHARSGLGRAALGSTAERLLHGRAPVLLMRPQSTASGTHDARETVSASS